CFTYQTAQFGKVIFAVPQQPRSHAASEGEDLMKLDFRQRLLTTTLFVGVGALATPAFAQTTPTPPTCPPGTPAGTGGCNPADTAGAANKQPETTAPQEGQTAVPSTNAQGSTVKSSQDIV